MGCSSSTHAGVASAPMSPEPVHIEPFKPGPLVMGVDILPAGPPKDASAAASAAAAAEQADDNQEPFDPPMLRRRGSSFRLGREQNPNETDEATKIKDQEKREQEMLREERRLTSDKEQNMKRISMMARAMTSDYDDY
eukprot:Opistho-2@10816